MTQQDEPYALADPAERNRRVRMLDLPHIAALTEFVRQLRSSSPSGYRIPYFDPCDGGVKARALFLLEAPGARAVETGFVSRNNPDPTAKNMCDLLSTASLLRGRTVIWNVIPWYVGSGSKISPARASDIDEATRYLERLLRLLPALQVAVLVGLKARSVASRLQALTHAEVLWTYHPSGRVFNVWPNKRAEILAVFRQAERKTRKGT
jgi:uracil-DNA glycosylase